MPFRRRINNSIVLGFENQESPAVLSLLRLNDLCAQKTDENPLSLTFTSKHRKSQNKKDQRVHFAFVVFGPRRKYSAAANIFMLVVVVMSVLLFSNLS